MNNRFEQWIEALREDGCRITAPRKAIIAVLASSERALEPAEIYALCQPHSPGVGLVTVYRTIERLEALGLVQRVHREDGCHMLMPAAEGHEHSLICVSCGRATLFHGDDLNALFTQVESNTGYRVSDHWLQLFGTCPTCLVKSSSISKKENID